ncbi:MAG: S41 family peptidase [Chloroflexi bacterium]|nr:S41 family peptidase [Chloroflexota bacterium]
MGSSSVKLPAILKATRLRDSPLDAALLAKPPAGYGIRRNGALVVAAVLLAAISFAGGFLTARFAPTPPSSLQWLLPSQTARPAAGGGLGQSVEAGGRRGTSAGADAHAPDDLASQFDVFWEAWNFVERDYYRRPVDRAKLVQGAIKGMLGALDDEYASYLDAAANRVEKATLDGFLEGIGASVDVKERHFVILAPLEDSPAAKAGLRTGDILLRVDGEELGNLSLAEVVALLGGPAGTKVRLVVQRFDDPEGVPVELELTRARIELEAVTSRMVAEGIGYVRIRFFGTSTVSQLTRALRDMRGKRVRGIIVDLRDNPGGYFNVGIDVASQFLREGSVVVIEERPGYRRQTVARGGGLATDITLAVLMNRGSASASEIVAGALRDHSRAVLIGEQTFGKGTVQVPRDLSDGSSVRVTVGKWLTPAGKLIHGHGIVPVIEARPSPEDEKAKRDVALEKALEWFRVPTEPATVPNEQ